jgi:hypothetical protein
VWLSNQLVTDVLKVVDEVFFVPYAATKGFNETRDTGEPIVFSGWYWAKGALEGGPFRSQSSAYRDAWFRLVAKRVPPRLHKDTQEFYRKQNRRSAAKAAERLPDERSASRRRGATEGSARSVKLKLVA